MKLSGAHRDLRQRSFLWGFASQAASSATNFGLTLLAGVTLGASGLGAVVVGFTSYLLALGLQRALISEPLVAGSSALEADVRETMGRAALTVSLLWAGTAALVVAAVGAMVGGQIGQGLLLFAPWIVPSLVQDYWRAVLFRDRRGTAAAANDSLWLAVMAITAPIAYALHAEWAVIGCWGLGAAAGAAAGFGQTRMRPERASRAILWWRTRAWSLGRWLAADFAVYTVGSQTLVFVFAAVLGTADLGGLRAAESVFAPLSLVGPALQLPGLPYMARRVADAPTTVRWVAARIGGAGALIGAAYLGVMFVTGGRILSLLFGHTFQSYDELFWPYGLGQIVTISTIGFLMLLMAEGRGRELLTARLVGAVATLALGIALALEFGVTGAAWGMTAGSAVAAVCIAAFALRTRATRSAVPGEAVVEGAPRP